MHFFFSFLLGCILCLFCHYYDSDLRWSHILQLYLMRISCLEGCYWNSFYFLCVRVKNMNILFCCVRLVYLIIYLFIFVWCVFVVTCHSGFGCWLFMRSWYGNISDVFLSMFLWHAEGSLIPWYIILFKELLHSIFCCCWLYCLVDIQLGRTVILIFTSIRKLLRI